MSKSLGHQMRNDPRVQEAKRLLQETLQDYQQQISGLRPGEAAAQAEYQKLIDHCSELRGGRLFYSYLSSGLGKGALVELEDGTVKYDFITGIGVHYMGHSHPKLLHSSIDAALEDTIMQGNLQQSSATVGLLELFVEAACRNGAALKHCFLTSSGAMANENALKMIFQKHQPAHRFLAFERGFCGRSMILAQITDKAANRVGLPKVLEVDYVPFYDPSDPEGSTRRAVDILQGHLNRHPGEYAGMILELIQGEGGYYPGDRAFFQALIGVLKENNVAVFVDEIQTFGRTEEIFAFQYYGLDSLVDVVTVGKSSQVCATLFTEAYKPQPGLVSQTFTSSASAIRAAKVVLAELTTGDYLGKEGKIAHYHNFFVHELEGIAQRHPTWIRGPFGFGVMVGITVMDGSLEKSKAFLHRLYHNGVLSFIAGRDPVRVRFLIPVGAVTEDDISTVCQIVEKTLEELAP